MHVGQLQEKQGQTLQTPYIHGEIGDRAVGQVELSDPDVCCDGLRTARWRVLERLVAAPEQSTQSS
jgi:hypothetical protein